MDSVKTIHLLRLRNHKNGVKTSGRLFIYHKLKLEEYWLRYSLTTQSRKICSQFKKIIKFVKFGPLIFSNCERTSDLTNVPASIYDRKVDTRPFDTIKFIVRCLSLVQSLLKGRNTPIWRKRKSTHMRPSGTDRLRYFWFFGNSIWLLPRVSGMKFCSICTMWSSILA